MVDINQIGNDDSVLFKIDSSRDIIRISLTLTLS